MKVVLVDYGVGNILSVSRALEAAGADVVRSVDPAIIASAGHVVVPGVGAFSSCMERLTQLHLIETLRETSHKGRPFLGICVGMQMLFDASEEFGVAEGLKLVPGRVRQLSEKAHDGSRLKIPHIGWNAIQRPEHLGDWRGTPLATTDEGTHFYFLHSFAGFPSSESNQVAQAVYGGQEFSAVVKVRQTFGVQFHPEKSGPAGIEVLRCFLAL